MSHEHNLAAPSAISDGTNGHISDEAIQRYREQGFARIRGVLTPEEAEYFREAALRVSRTMKKMSDGPVFSQLVNVWREDETMKRLTLHPNIAAAATRLAGTALRLWHDQILIKQPQNKAATHFHQDQPYWPHAEAPHPISCWMALCDVPPERGCMTFLPGSHRRTDLKAQNLGSPDSLFSLCPDLQWQERVTVPLRAGDCTFHHGRCAHMATPNQTDEPRVAHIVIFMEAGARYSGARHVVTDPLGLEVGDALSGELFPTTDEFTNL